MKFFRLSIRFTILIIACIFCTCQILLGQIDVGAVTIRGIPVTQISTVGLASSIDVTDASALRANDRVLIHQAKGMVLSATLNDSGTPVSQGTCGNFEFATIESVSGSTIFLTSLLERSYDVNALVQLVPVISSSRVTVNGPLTAEPWNGACGGIIAIEATDSIVLNSPINVTGVGFFGGDVSLVYGSCGLSADMDAPNPSALYGQKGEGCASVDIDRQSGRGRLANGGGGGANHNAGGAGGGNGGEGGHGGAVYGVCGVQDNGGLGGSVCIVSALVPQMFFGGGGGGGHQNENLSSGGGVGGGIVILVSPIIVSTINNPITSKGADARIAQHEGSSGGGAGGTVFIDCATIVGPLTIDVSGGNGGDIGWVFAAPHGPGGGGGGGQVMLSLPCVPSSLTTLTAGGINGVNTYYPTGVEHDWYARPGSAGRITTNCVLNARATKANLRQVSAGDLGSRAIGTIDTVNILFTNDGPADCMVNSFRERNNVLQILSTIPTLPVLVRVGDTVIVRAEIPYASEQRFNDTLDVLWVAGGCDESSSFAITWLAVRLTDTCSFDASLSSDTVSTGGTTRIVAIVDRKYRVTPPAHYTAVIRYTSADVYIEPSASSPTTYFEHVGDQTLFHIEDDWVGSDTLFAFEALGLLSGNSVTSIIFDSLSIWNGLATCASILIDTTIVFRTVCLSRAIRSVLILRDNVVVTAGQGSIEIDANTFTNDLSSHQPLTLTIWSVIGTQISHGTISNGRTRITLPTGAFVVCIYDGAGIRYTGLVVM